MKHGENTSKAEYKRIACYIRVSTDEQAKEWFWLESQRRLLKVMIDSNEDKGWITSDALIYQDEGISWVTPVSERPALSRLQKDILDKKVDGVAVFRIDRLFRKSLHLLQFVEWLKAQNINFISKSENIDLHSSSGRMVLSILSAVAESERETIMERTREGKLSLALRGYYIFWRQPPFGYKKVHDGRGNKLEIDEFDAQIVRDIFDMFVRENKGTGEIAQILTAKWVGTRADRSESESTKGRIHKNLIRQGFITKVLWNEAYRGVYYCNKSLVKHENWKIITEYKDKSEWIGIPCPEIIDKKLFNLAKERLAKSKVVHGRGEKHAFTGILKCGECGNSMNYYLSHKKTGNYRCWGKKKDRNELSHICTNPDISEKKVFETINPIIIDMLTNAESFVKRYRETKNGKQGGNRKDTIQKEILDIEETLRKKEETKKRAVRQSLENPDDEKTYTSILEDLRKEISILDTRKQELIRNLAMFEEQEWLYMAVLENREKYKDRLAEISETDILPLIERFVDKIIVERERLRVILKVIESK